MATVDLTLEQILAEVEQLSPAERKRLQREMAARAGCRVGASSEANAAAQNQETFGTFA